MDMQAWLCMAAAAAAFVFGLVNDEVSFLTAGAGILMIPGTSRILVTTREATVTVEQ